MFDLPLVAPFAVGLTFTSNRFAFILEKTFGGTELEDGVK